MRESEHNASIFRSFWIGFLLLVPPCLILYAAGTELSIWAFGAFGWTGEKAAFAGLFLITGYLMVLGRFRKSLWRKLDLWLQDDDWV